MKRIPKIKQLQETVAGTIIIDWDSVEEIIGFQLHDNLKDFYSRILGSKNKCGEISGRIKFSPIEFVKRYVNREDWLINANKNRSCAEFTLDLLTQLDVAYVADYFGEAFHDWTGGNDFGHRIYIGEILINRGQISLILNNDTGEFEWVDFGYGYFEVYEENPYGIVADSTQEFLDKFILAN